MTESEFRQLAAQGFNRIPLVLETFADLDTPLSVYLKLANRPWSYLLESVQGGERFGRYSFIGLPAATRISVFGGHVQVEIAGVVAEASQTSDPLEFIGNYLNRFKAAQVPGLPRFCGGLVGYFGYETVRYIERKLDAAPKPSVPEVPDILLLLSMELVVVDNLSGKLYLIVYADPAARNAYANARRRLDELRSRLRRAVEI